MRREIIVGVASVSFCFVSCFTYTRGGGRGEGGREGKEGGERSKGGSGEGGRGGGGEIET